MSFDFKSTLNKKDAFMTTQLQYWKKHLVRKILLKYLLQPASLKNTIFKKSELFLYEL